MRFFVFLFLVVIATAEVQKDEDQKPTSFGEDENEIVLRFESVMKMAIFAMAGFLVLSLCIAKKMLEINRHIIKGSLNQNIEAKGWMNA